MHEVHVSNNLSANYRPRSFSLRRLYFKVQLTGTSNPTISALSFHFLLSNNRKGFCSVPSKIDAAQLPLHTQHSSDSSFVPKWLKYNKMKTWRAKNISQVEPVMVIKSMNTETMANNTISLRDLKQQGGRRHEIMVEADTTCSLIDPNTWY